MLFVLPQNSIPQVILMMRTTIYVEEQRSLLLKAIVYGIYNFSMLAVDVNKCCCRFQVHHCIGLCLIIVMVSKPLEVFLVSFSFICTSIEGIGKLECRARSGLWLGFVQLLY